MKKLKSLIVLLMSLFISSICNAHIYDPISTEGKQWEYKYSDESVATYTIQGDTIIDEKAYKKLMASDCYIFGDNEWHFFAGVRDSQRKTYIRYNPNLKFPIDCYIEFDIKQEILLYDFGVGGLEHECQFSGMYIYCNYAWNNLLRNHERRIISFWTDTSKYPDDTFSVIDMYEAIEGIGKIGPSGNPFFPYSWKNGSLIHCSIGNDVLYQMDDRIYFETPPTGDANGDGIADVEDVNAVINKILKLPVDVDKWDDVSAGIYDKVDVEDVNALINIILKLE